MRQRVYQRCINLIGFQVKNLFRVFVLFGTKLPWILLSFLLKYQNCKCHPKWGPDDLVSIPALDGTVECNKFLCFNLLYIDRKKSLSECKISKCLKMRQKVVYQALPKAHKNPNGFDPV